MALGRLRPNRKLILVNAARVLSLGLCTLGCFGCEVGTSVRLENGPRFLLDGSGRVVSFRVYGPLPGHKMATVASSKSLIWDIEPSSGSPSGVMAAALDIEYGSVPQGYVQTVPSDGPAPPLKSGLLYAFSAQTTGASGGHGEFYLQSDKPILINVPSLCQSSLSADATAVKCGTREPYPEPSDIEAFVKENRAAH